MSIQPLSLNANQLTEFQNWKQVNSENFSLIDYLFGVSNMEVAIAFTKLFWPDFIEYENGVFFASTFNSEIYAQWKEKLGHDIGAIERVINHKHIDDLLPGAENVGYENLLYLAQVLTQMWESRLKLLYPDRHFKMQLNQDEGSVVLMFYQVMDEDKNINIDKKR